LIIRERKSLETRFQIMQNINIKHLRKNDKISEKQFELTHKIRECLINLICDGERPLYLIISLQIFHVSDQFRIFTGRMKTRRNE
jgi:hypothetical protein